MTEYKHKRLLSRVVAKPSVCGGEPCIRGTRIHISVILDSLAEGLTPDKIIEHFPTLTQHDVRAAIAYASELARAVSAA